MELYLLRHAIAEPQAPDGSDAARALTDEGVERMRAAARGMRRLKLRIDALLTSPLVRARETAEIVAQALSCDPQVAGALAPGCDTARLLALLDSVPRADRVMVVGHEPDLSTIIAELCGARVRMKKSGLALVDLARPEPGSGTLVCLLAPRVLRALAD